MNFSNSDDFKFEFAGFPNLNNEFIEEEESEDISGPRDQTNFMIKGIAIDPKQIMGMFGNHSGFSEKDLSDAISEAMNFMARPEVQKELDQIVRKYSNPNNAPTEEEPSTESFEDMMKNIGESLGIELPNLMNNPNAQIPPSNNFPSNQDVMNMLGSVIEQSQQEIAKSLLSKLGINVIPEDPEGTTQKIDALLNNIRIHNPVAVKRNFSNNFFQYFDEKDEYLMEDIAVTDINIMSSDAENDSDSGNEAEIFADIKKFILLEAYDKFILCRAIPNDDDQESFIVAFAEETETGKGNLVAYIPTFGNSIAKLENKFYPFSHNETPSFFDENGSLVEEYIADIDKIKAECELVFYDSTEAITSVYEFGDILQVKQDVKYTADYICMGTIHPNGSFKSKQAIKDFNLDTSANKFNFYIKLKENHLPDELNIIGDLLNKIDFNENDMIQNADIMRVSDGIGIEVDIETLENNIKKWKKD